MDYIGIDVGENKYYIAFYSDNTKYVSEDSIKNFSKCEDVNNWLKGKNAIIAIDAPLKPSTPGNKRRKCEEILGIGGYYSTPDKREKAARWMHSGFDLWEFLMKEGYKIANSTKRGNLIEVHPTIIFKKMANPQITNKKQWIRLTHPPKKQSKDGRDYRKKLLCKKGIKIKSKLGRTKKEEVDYLDALIAAYTAEQYNTNNVSYAGDPNEGLLWYPKA